MRTRDTSTQCIRFTSLAILPVVLVQLARFPCIYCRRLFRLNVIYVQVFFLESCFHEAACIVVDMMQNTLGKHKWVQNSCKNFLAPSKLRCFTLMCTWCNMSQETFATFQKTVKLGYLNEKSVKRMGPISAITEVLMKTE